MKNEFFTKNAEETKQIARQFARTIIKNEVIALFGELGSGKTTFVQGFAEEFGIQRKITSPTFVMIKAYPVLSENFQNKIAKRGIKSLYHLDLYRAQSHSDVATLGISDIMENPENILLIEWAQKLGPLLFSRKHTEITFTYVSETERKITIKNHE